MVANSADNTISKRKMLNAIAVGLSKINNHPLFAEGKIKEWLTTL